MEIIECRAQSEDGYPAGLRLACDLWRAIEVEKDSGIQVRGIRSLWDGVKLEGVFQKHGFEVEFSYATEDVVLLVVQIRSKFLSKNNFAAKVLAELKKQLELFISAMPGRTFEDSPSPAGWR